MQLEQQEAFVLQGPQLEALGEIETRLPPPAKKRSVAGLVLAAAVLVSVFGIGGARLKGVYKDTREIYTSQVDEYGHGIQTDFAAQADAAASMIKVAGLTLGEDDPAVQAAQQGLDAWNAAAAARDPAVQYDLNVRLYGAVNQLYTAACGGTDSSHHDGHTENGSRQSQLDALYDQFLSAQATIDRAAAEYNVEVGKYNDLASGFPAGLIAPLWGAGGLQAFAPGG